MFARPTKEQLAQAQQAISPELMALFMKMQPGEQVHSLEIFSSLLAQGASNPDLLAAALLHDVGKIHYPLHPWERAAIVLARRLIPDQVERWGKSTPVGWKRPFVVAEQHATWGADLAAAAGASSVTIEIIRRHQTKLPPPSSLENQRFSEEKLLHRLQLIDDES